MKRNFYEILNLDEKLIPYFLRTDQLGDIENGPEYRNQKIRELYETQSKKIKEHYQAEFEKLKNEKETSISMGMKKLVIKSKYTPKKVKEANERAIEEEQQKFRKRAMQIKQKYQLKIAELDAAYECVKTEELRQKYNKSIDNPQEEKLYIEYMREIIGNIKQEIKEKQNKERYSKAEKYNPELIKTINKGKNQGKKLVARESSKDPVIISLDDERKIKIKCTGTIHFANLLGCQSYVNEYQIERVVDNQPKVDTVYTMLDLPKLGFNKNTGKPSNLQYYNCVTNKLLSEEAIEGSKYNGGYIGLVEKNENGYDITIDKKLSEEEEENLTAVMILNAREEKRKNISRQRKGEDR